MPGLVEELLQAVATGAARSEVDRLDRALEEEICCLYELTPAERAGVDMLLDAS